MRIITELDFQYNKHKPWLTAENGYFSGSVFIGNCLMSEEQIKNAMESIKTVNQAIDFVKSLNGHFAAVIYIDGAVFISVDRERTIPLFYEVKNDTVTIYNHVSLDMIKKHGINENALNDLDCCLFVTGRENIAKNIFSVSAGEAVVISDTGINRQYYHEFDYDKVEYPDKEELFSLIDKKFVDVTKRLITYLNGRCAVVPLSGGHDSRLIVYYLKRLGYDNIITYTYGPKGNFEATTSEKVAKFLGLDWHFVAYEPKELQKLFKRDFENLVDFYSNGDSSVCIQDWYAVDCLQREKIIPEDAVFVPGHSFDAITGSFILPKYANNDSVTKQQLMNDIIWKHFSEGSQKYSTQKRKHIEAIINDKLLKDEPECFTNDRAFNLYQNYNVRERQAKYVCSSVKLYEYYGYDWFLPLWDNELIDFWETISLKLKYNRKLFFEFTQHQYADLMAAAPVENEKSKNIKKVNMNPIVRVVRKIHQLINYVDYHYCLAYFNHFDVVSMYLRKRVLNIGYFVNQKIKKIVRIKND